MTATTTLPVLFATGIHSARPAASAVGAGGLYSCTTHSLVYQTDGSSWTTWATLGGTNPMTTQDDIIVGGASGTPARLAKGSDGQVLTVDPSTHHLVFATPSSGSVASDTIWDAAGDLAVGSGSNTAAKLTVGSDGTVLTVSPSTHVPVWSAPGAVAPSASAYDSAVSALTPAAYWKFDESASGFSGGGGTFVDSVAANNITVTGSGTQKAKGHVGPFGPGSGSWFLGTGDDGVAGAAVTGSDDRTLVCWVRIRTLNTAHKNIISERSGAGSGKYGITLTLGPHAVGGGIDYHFGGGIVGDNFNTEVGAYNGSPLERQWHHVAVVVDGTASSTYVVGQMKLYVDGVQLTTGSDDTYAGTARAAPVNPEALKVFGGGSSTFIEGWISRVALFSTALSGANIAALYAASPHI